MTAHFDPAVVGADRLSDWTRAETFDAFLARAEDLVDLWTTGYERAPVSPEWVERAEAAPGAWKLLVLTEDWCIDATATVAPLAKFAASASNVELRVLDRDDNLGLMDEHLTNGRSRSIPVVLVLDEAGVERAWWGPRPADLQAWFEGDGQGLEKDERYRELRKWYARDRGRSTVAEVVGIIGRVAGVEGVA